MSYLKNFTKILRGSINTSPGGVAGTPGAYHLPVRKVVLRYSEVNPSSSGARSFILSPQFVSLTRLYPSVEFVVSAASPEKHPLATGFYTTTKNARKDINLANLDKNQVEQKLRLIINSSGKKIKSLKRQPTISKNQSPRGIWSQLHDSPKQI